MWNHYFKLRKNGTLGMYRGTALAVEEIKPVRASRHEREYRLLIADSAGRNLRRMGKLPPDYNYKHW